MAIVLYDLVGVDDRRFSPNCWRTRLALAHKGLDCDARPTRFTEIGSICGGGQKTIPVIEDGDSIVGDSWAIANYLEDTYPDRPSLFGGDGGRAVSVFFQNWVNTIVNPGVIKSVIADIHDHLTPEDQGYFRATREKFLGGKLEDIQSGREERLAAFRATLTPLRQTLKAGPFVCGDGPLYADYLAFAPFQWARSISPFKLLDDDDPITGWFQRCLDLYDGLGRQSKGYD